MWNLICVSLFLIQGFCVAQSSLELIPEVQCANAQCPQLDCLNTVLINGSCCRICVTEVQGCVKDGISYEEGSIIPSNATDACEICYCCEGKSICGNISESCPQLKCNKSQQVKDAEKCCARCLNENNTFSAEINANCTENGITYQEGDVWNPYFSKFGTVKCQECTCRNGTKLCKLVPCPPVRPCTADDPVEEIITTCCPKCNRSLSEQQNTTINNNSTLQELNLVPDIPTESTIACPLVYAYRIYETINTTKDQIAIENINFSYVDIYVWSPESKTVQYEFCNSDRFEQQYLNVRFKYIGDTTVESVKTLVDWFNIKRKRFSLKYCKSNCSPRVIEILQPCK